MHIWWNNQICTYQHGIRCAYLMIYNCRILLFIYLFLLLWFCSEPRCVDEGFIYLYNAHLSPANCSAQVFWWIRKKLQVNIYVNEIGNFLKTYTLYLLREETPIYKEIQVLQIASWNECRIWCPHLFLFCEWAWWEICLEYFLVRNSW